MGQHGYSIFRPFAAADEDFVAGEIDVLDPQAHALHQPQPCAVHERGYLGRVAHVMMEVDEPLDPMAISLLRASAVVA